MIRLLLLLPLLLLFQAKAELVYDPPPIVIGAIVEMGASIVPCPLKTEPSPPNVYDICATLPDGPFLTEIMDHVDAFLIEVEARTYPEFWYQHDAFWARRIETNDAIIVILIPAEYQLNTRVLGRFFFIAWLDLGVTP